MIRYFLKITALEPLVFSEKSTTTGGHKALDYIPGSALFGLTAQRFYEEIDAWQVFHSGAVRFGNGYLATAETQRTLPMALCLHQIKGDDNWVYNLARAERPHGQLKQFRQGFLHPENLAQLYKTPKGSALKTAIDFKRKTAASAQLFSYSHIKPDTTFIATLSVDDGQEQNAEKIVDYLQGKHRIGRSRSAEFGRVAIEVLGEEKIAEPTGEGMALAYCASDLWLDKVHHGKLPEAKDFGFKEGTLDTKRSFINYRSLTPYNSKFNLTLSERLLIKAGSVLCFENCEGTPSAYVGQGQEFGLGEMLYNPDFLKENEVKNALQMVDLRAKENIPNTLSEPKTKLFTYMKSKKEGEDKKEQSFICAEKKAEEWKKLYYKAMRYSAQSESDLAGPSKSQWSHLAKRAREAAIDKKTEIDKKFACLERDLLKTFTKDDEEWGRAIEPNRSHHSVLENYMEELKGNPKVNPFLALELLADKMGKVVDALILEKRNANENNT